jgi:hypothetical protein
VPTASATKIRPSEAVSMSQKKGKAQTINRIAPMTMGRRRPTRSDHAPAARITPMPSSETSRTTPSSDVRASPRIRVP